MNEYVVLWLYRGADKSLTRAETSSEARQGRARFQQHRDASCHQVFFLSLQGKAPKEIHAILTETLTKDLTAHMYLNGV